MKELILTNEQIQEKVKTIAKDLETKFKNNKTIPIFIGVLKGAAPFFMDLLKYYTLPMKCDYIQVSSYDGTGSTGVIHLKSDLSTNIENKDVVIIEDIIDTGLTLKYLKEYIQLKYKPKSITIVCFLDKKALRKTDLVPDYVGMTLLENKFLVGYGFDYNELWRNCNYIFVPTEDEIKEWDNILKNDVK